MVVFFFSQVLIIYEGGRFVWKKFFKIIDIIIADIDSRLKVAQKPITPSSPGLWFLDGQCTSCLDGTQMTIREV